MKQYYKLIDPFGMTKYNTSPVVSYWHGDTTKSKILLALRGFVLPLGTAKPKNVSRETIYEF